MQRRTTLEKTIGVLVLLTACSGESGAQDAASPDAGSQEDAGRDAGPAVDAVADVADGHPDVPEANPRRGFVAVHLEAHATPNLAYQQDHWSTLVDLVAAADAHEVRLTLEMNPQWGMFLLDPANSAKLQDLHAMMPRHEIGLHHHGPSHPDWNGFTNDPSFVGDPRYQGTIQQMMGSFLVPLVAGAAQDMILTAGGTNESTDWPPLVPFDTDGGAAQSDLLTYPPYPVVDHGATSVRQIRYRQFATGDPNAADLQEVEAHYEDLDAGAVMGLVFHCQDFRHRPAEVEALFASLRDHDVKVLPVREILDSGS